MSDQEMKTEAIRLINEIDADRMEDLLACLRVFREQQDYNTSASRKEGDSAKHLQVR